MVQYSCFGVVKYDGVTMYKFSDVLDNQIMCISTDSLGNMWFGSFQNGAYKYYGVKWKETRWTIIYFTLVLHHRRKLQKKG